LTELSIISLFATATLFLIGILSCQRDTSGGMEGNGAQKGSPPPPPTEESLAEDKSILLRLDALLRRDQVFRDAGLTLRKLASAEIAGKTPFGHCKPCHGRKHFALHQQLANRIRLRTDRTWENITKSMVGMDFNTKSGFNR